MPVREIGPASTYNAYAGPDTGGFGLVPQDILPNVDEGLRRRMIGDANTPPSPFAGTKPIDEAKFGTLRVREIGPAANAGVQPVAATSPAPTPPAAAVPPPPEASSPLVNQTLVPKGGVPQQLNKNQADVFGAYDQQMNMGKAMEGEKFRYAIPNMVRSAVKEFSNNLLATPTAAADLMSYPQRALLSGGAAPIRATPDLTIGKIASGMHAAEGALQGKGLVDTYNQSQNVYNLKEGAREAANPTSTFAGNVLGDVGTMVAGRVPFARGLVAATKTPQELEAAAAALSKSAPGYLRQWKQVLSTPYMRDVQRGLGKIAETGAEGASLALLHNGNPIETAAWAGGMQGLGSIAMGMITHPKTAVGAIAASTIAWQMLKDATPGGKDYILDSIEHAIKHATIGTIVGIGAAAFGAGRYRGSKYFPFGHNYAQNMPELAEGVNAALRANPTSIIEQLNNDSKTKNPVLGPMMDKITSNISAFTSEELSKISRAVQGNDARGVIQGMLNDDPRFAKRMGM